MVQGDGGVAMRMRSGAPVTPQPDDDVGKGLVEHHADPTRVVARARGMQTFLSAMLFMHRS